MPITKAQLAAVAASMPGASDEEILAKAKQAEAPAASGGFGSFLSDLASGIMNHPSETLSGFLQGAKAPAIDAAKGLGDVAMGMGQMLTTPPEQSAQNIAQALNLRMAQGQAPGMADAVQMLTGVDPHASYARMGGQALGGLLLAHGLTPKASLEALPKSSQPELSRPNVDALPSSEAPQAAVAQASAPAAGPTPAAATSQTSAPPSSDTGGVSSQPVYDVPTTASTVADLISKNGGATFNLYKGDLAGTDHYAVAAYPERGQIVEGQATPDHIANYVQQNSDLLNDPSNSVGTWQNDGKTYLDIAKTIPDKNQALQLGLQGDQKAIFNLKDLSEIPVIKRLYRGESSVSTPGALAGQTFTDDPLQAAYYAKQGGGAGQTFYLDLPADEAAQYRTADATGQGVHILPPELAAQARNNVLGAGAEGQSIILPKQAVAAPSSTATPAPQLPPEFTPVGEEPPYQAPQFKDPMQGIQDTIAAAGGRNLNRVAKEQAAKGITSTLPTAMAIAAPAASAALPDDSDNPLVKYGKVGLDLLGAGGLLMAGVRGHQVPELSSEMDAAARGAAGMWLGGKKGFQAATGDFASNPKVQAAAQKMIDNHLKTTMDSLPNVKKLLALNKAGAADASWYDATADELKKAFGDDAPLVARLFAATSNNATVSANAALTLKALRQIKMGQPIEGYLPPVIENIKRAMANEPLNGRKIDNFAKAMSGDPNAVVVDRWVMRAFGFNKGTAPTDAQYDFMENAIRQLAAKTNQTPAQVQAALWFATKNAAEEGKGRPPSPPPQQALQDALGRLQDQAGVENRKFDKARAAGPQLPFAAGQ